MLEQTIISCSLQPTSSLVSAYWLVVNRSISTGAHVSAKTNQEDLGKGKILPGTPWL